MSARAAPPQRWVAALAAAAALAANAAAAAPKAAPIAAQPRGHYAALDALPDWGGVWVLNFTPPAPGTAPAGPDLKGTYLEHYKAWQDQVRATGGQVPRHASYCLPPGMPGIMGVPQYPLEFLFTPGRVTLHFEAWMQWRTIWTDGRGHPQDLDPGFYGHSIGHWEGATLVVDTIGIKEAAALGFGIAHSPALHLVERMHLAAGDPDTLVVEMTAEDPEALNAPWHTTHTYHRVRDGELLEFICEENDRNPVDAAGKTGFE